MNECGDAALKQAPVATILHVKHLTKTKRVSQPKIFQELICLAKNAPEAARGSICLTRAIESASSHVKYLMQLHVIFAANDFQGSGLRV
jgi:hypothetical protein